MRVAILIAVLAASAGAEAPVEARLTLTPPEVPLTRTSTLTLSVEAPADLDIRLPDLRKGLGGAETFDRPLEGSEIVDGHRRRQWVSYVLDPVRPGEYAIDPVQVVWGDGEGVTVPGVVLRVRALTPEEEASVREFRPILVPAGRTGWTRYWPVAAAGLLAAAVVAALAMRRRLPLMPGHAERILLPWEAALERLEALKARNLSGPEGIDAYYVELSAILRHYIENRFHIHAPEQTTPEFLAEASRAGLFTDEHQRLLAGVLRHSDRVKFARYTPTGSDMERVYGEVRRYVEETTPRREPDGEAAA